MKKNIRRSQIIGKIELLNQPYAGERILHERPAEELAAFEADLQRRLRDRI